MVNVKLRNLNKKIMSETLEKTLQLEQDCQSKCLKCPPRAFTQTRSVGLENRKVV